MGAVYLVRHFRMRETVLAMKVLLPDVMSHPQIRARFIREGDVMSAFDHKHIVRVFSNGMVHDDSKNIDYILMEYIDGKTLHNVLKEKEAQGQHLELAQVLEFASHIAKALLYAHTQQPAVIHRDIKPGNIMIAEPTHDPPDNYYPLGRAVVMDWGIAKKLVAEDTQLTGLWTMIGTPRYCAPEQMRPLDSVGVSADVYALGMVVYEMYAGKPFFAGLDNESIIRRVRDDLQENEPHFERPTDSALINLIRKAIAKDRAHRYQRVEEFLRDLETYRQSLADATPLTEIFTSPRKGDTEDKDQQRQRLEEHQRNQTFQLQTQVKNAREKALLAGAGEWAVSLFQQGIVREEEAGHKLEDRHYFLAQEAYEEAKRLFERAHGEALPAAQHRAEQARQDMLEAKVGAERYGAKERAQRFYRDGLSLEDEARGLEETKQYRQAAEAYEKAKSAFEDARELAHDALRGEIEAERELVLEEKEAAQAEGAEQFAAESFAEARRQEEQAAAALEQEELTRAYALYHSTLQKYAHAHEQARLERQHQDAEQWRHRAEEARAKAEQCAARHYAPAHTLQAYTMHDQANEQFEAQQYPQAAQAYERAQQAYEQAIAEAERAQQDQLATIRRQIAEIQTTVQHLRLEQLSPLEHAQVQLLIEKGEASAARGEFAQAVEDYRQALEQFTELKETAIKQYELERQETLTIRQGAQVARQAAEEAGAKQEAADLYKNGETLLAEMEQLLQAGKYREATDRGGKAVAVFSHAHNVSRQNQAKRAAETANLQQEDARVIAEQVGAKTYFAERYTATVALVERAREYFTQSKFTESQTYYERATQEFAYLRGESISRAAQEQAEAARQLMTNKKQIAVEYAEWAGARIAEAQEKESEAESAWTAQDYVRATELYREAERKYTAARTEAEEERERRIALAARQSAEQEHSAAEQEAAPLHATALYVRANATLQQGEQQWTARQWAAAAEAFSHAQQLFAQARHETQQELERQAVEQEQRETERAQLRREVEKAQQEAVAAKADAVIANADQYAARLFKQGTTIQDKAEQSLASEDLPQAAQYYRQAQEFFHKASTKSQKEKEKHAAAAACSAATESQAAAEQVGAHTRLPQQYAEARQNYEQGKSAEAQRNFVEARQRYEQAIRRFDELQREALLQVARESAAEAQKHAEDSKQQLSLLATWLDSKWSEGQEQEAQARQSWENQEYEKATELFLRAGETYKEARVEAENRRDHQHALDARQHAQDAQHQAERADVQRYAQTLYLEATGIQQRGAQALSRNQWLEAEEHFARAAQLFTDAVALASREKAREAAEASHRQAESEAKSAQEAGAENRFEAKFVAARGLVEQGVEHEKRQEFSRAQELYAQATQSFLQLRQEALFQANREKATEEQRQLAEMRDGSLSLREWAVARWTEAQRWELQADQAYRNTEYEHAIDLYQRARQIYAQAQQAAEQERLRHSAEQARQLALRAKSEADKEEASRYAATQVAAAEVVFTEAERLFSTEDFAASTNAYRKAEEDFAQAATAARRECARLAMVGARTQAEAAQTRAEECHAAQRYAPEFADALRFITDGQEKEAHQEFDPASHAYQQAARRFLQLRQRVEEQIAAEEEQRRRKAMDAHQEAERSQTTADAAQALHYVEIRYQRAVEAKRRGEQNLADKKWEEATAQLRAAVALFVEVEREAQRLRARQEAEAARNNALQSQQDALAVTGQDIFPERFSEAGNGLREAEQTFAQENFTTARALFEKSSVLFRQISQDAVEHIQREKAAHLRAQVLELQGHVQHLKARKKRPAEQALTEADQRLADHRYTEALQKYQEAAALFAQLRLQQPVPVQSDSSLERSTTLLSVRNPVVLFSSLALLIVVAGVTVWITRQPAPQTLSPLPLSPQDAPSHKTSAKAMSPRITKMSPEATKELSVAEGKELTFTVDAEGSRQESLRYSWSLDGRKQEEGKQWTYRPDFDESDETPKEVEVVVTDGKTAPAQQKWKVLVQNTNREPMITATTPSAGPVETMTGEKPEFTIQASDPDTEDRLAYVWSVDGKEISRGERGGWQLPESLANSSHQVKAEVIDPSGAKTQVTWDVAFIPPPKVEPPRITKVNPEPIGEIAVAEGKEITFAVDTESPQQKPLRVTWFLNGKRQEEGKQWTYQPKVGEGGEKLKEVKVEVSNGETSPVQRIWQIRVLKENRPPVIAATTPKTGTVEVAVGETRKFTVEASDPNKDDRLAYIWTIDGRETARGKNESWQLPTSLAEGEHRVTVDVMDKEGLKATTVTWNVVAKAAIVPPRIAKAQPRSERLEILAGEPLDFSLTATVPGRKKDENKLSYQWSINDGPPQTTETGAFRFSESKPGAYQLAAVVRAPDGLQSEPKNWFIVVKAREPIAPKEEKDVGEFRRTEVETWLEAVKRAFAEKDAEQLARLGVVDQEGKRRLESIFTAENSHIVQFENVSIDIKNNRATATGTRVDIIDGRRTPPVTVSFSLEKDANGRVVMRR